MKGSLLNIAEKSAMALRDQAAGESAGQGLPAHRPDVAGAGHTPTIRVLRLDDVMQITGLGKTTIYQLQNTGEFPRRVKMTTQAVGWIEDEVRSWIKTRMAARTTSGDGQASFSCPDNHHTAASSRSKKRK